jgi:hypothetical protein
MCQNWFQNDVCNMRSDKELVKSTFLLKRNKSIMARFYARNNFPRL